MGIDDEADGVDSARGPLAVAAEGDRPGLAPVLVIGAAAAVVALDAVIVRDPDLLALELELSAGLVAALVVIGALCALMFLRRGVAVALLVGLVYLNLSEVLVRFHDFPSVLQLLFVPFALVALVWVVPRRAAPRLGNGLTGLVTAYFVLLLASTAWARDVAVADEMMVANLKALAIYALVALLLTSVQDARKAAWALVLAAGLPAALGTFQMLTGDFGSELGGFARIKDAQIYGDVFEPRIAGTLGDPNFFAQMLVLALPVAVMLVKLAPDRRRRLVAGSCATIILCGIVLSYSRGAALALLVIAPLLLLALELDPRWILVGAGAGAVIVALLLPADFTRRLATIEQLLPGGQEETLDPDSSFAERRLLMTVAWRMFLDHPGVGVGAGNYAAHFDDYMEGAASASRRYADPEDDAGEYPHNLYLEVAAETGLLGLALLGAVFATAFLYLRRAGELFRRRGNRFGASLARGLVISLVGYLICGLFLHLQFPRPLWVVLGLAAGLHGLARLDGGAATGAAGAGPTGLASTGEAT